MTLYELTAEQQAIESALYENGGELTEELAQALDANEQDIQTKLVGYNKFLRNLEGTENAVDAEIKRLQGLKKTAQNAQRNLKAHLLYVMQTLGIDKIDAGTVKASRRKSQSLQVDEAQLLAAYAEKIEQIASLLPAYCSVEIKVNKTEIKNQYKGSDVLPAGCEMVENESVSLR